MRLLLSSLLTVLLSLLAVSSQAATISGTVRSAADGRDLQGMTVAAYSEAGVLQSSGATDSKGRYSLTLSSGSYKLLAFDPLGAFATSFYQGASSFESTVALSVSGSQTLSNIDFSLQRGGRVTGRVVTSSGAPIAGAVVTAYNLDGSRRAFTFTDGNGRYSLVLAPGQYKLAAFDEGGLFAPEFLVGQSTFVAASVITVSSDVTLAGSDFVLGSLARVTGTVLESGTSRPLAGLTVAAYSLEGALITMSTTDALGRFALSLPAGTVKLVTSDPAGVFATSFFEGADSFVTARALVLGAGAAMGVEITVQAGGRLVGRVTDASTGAGLSGITVEAYNLSGTQRATTLTDASGAYSLFLPPGEYKLAAFDKNVIYVTQFFLNKETFASASRAVVVARQIVGNVNFSLSRGTRASGMVVDLITGRPIPGITIGAYDLAGLLVASGTTDVGGRWALSLPPGIYKFVASDAGLRYATSYYSEAPNFETALPVTVATQPIDSFRFALRLGGKISGSVIAAATGAPLAGIIITAHDSSGGIVGSGVTDANGKFEFAILPGAYRIIASDPTNRFGKSYYLNAPGFESATPLSVSIGQTTTPFTFQLQAARSRHRAVTPK
ncbi:MAG TPA: carboxypeptidase regulatory-like domain-containing protein [Thermoanaerobaculia bacterium]|nr:carboxypeptidase regulatory-like domain-containing protein [Thermoanaerobaculia bacterium]